MHQLSPERLVAIHKTQLSERGQKQCALHLLNLREAGHSFADYIIAHQGDAVIGAACAVVKIIFAAKIGAPVREVCRVLPLYLPPDRLPLLHRIVQRDLPQNLFLQGLEYST